MNESVIEKAGTKYAESLGWMVYKASSPGKVGVHDRIHHKNGVTFYIEYKATGKKASPKQQKFAKQLRDAGIPCRCCDSISKAANFIDNMEYSVPVGIYPQCININLSSFNI